MRRTVARSAIFSAVSMMSTLAGKQQQARFSLLHTKLVEGYTKRSKQQLVPEAQSLLGTLEHMPHTGFQASETARAYGYLKYYESYLHTSRHSEAYAAHWVSSAQDDFIHLYVRKYGDWSKSTVM